MATLSQAVETAISNLKDSQMRLNGAIPSRVVQDDSFLRDVLVKAEKDLHEAIYQLSTAAAESKARSSRATASRQLSQALKPMRRRRR